VKSHETLETPVMVELHGNPADAFFEGNVSKKTPPHCLLTSALQIRAVEMCFTVQRYVFSANKQKKRIFA